MSKIQSRLAALNNPEWDSDEDEEDVAKPSAADQAASKATVAAARRQGKAAAKAARAKATAEASAQASCVCYIGHLPHGFFEDQMTGFFSQFGDVERLRVARSKKTGNSKGCVA